MLFKGKGQQTGADQVVTEQSGRPQVLGCPGAFHKILQAAGGQRYILLERDILAEGKVVQLQQANAARQIVGGCPHGQGHGTGEQHLDIKRPEPVVLTK